MNITTAAAKRGVQVLHVQESSVDSYSARVLEAALWDLIRAGTTKILVDLSAVDFMSSGGLRALLAAYKEVHQHEDGDLRAYGLNDQVRKVFEVAGFDKFMTLAPDQATAERGL